MPLTADDFIHENNGAMSSSSTSIVVSLAGSDSTTAGNTVLVFMSLAPTFIITPPSGFVQDTSTGSGALLAFRKSEVSAAETSWTFTASSATLATWYVVEMSNVDPVEPLDANAGSGAPASTANGGTRSTGTTSLNAGLSSAQFAVFFSTRATSGSIQSWSGYTNSFEEVADNPGTATSGAPTIAVARNFRDGSTSTFQSTATFASSGGSANTCAMMVVYRAADSPVVAPLAGVWGFEWGTHGGLALGGSTTLGGYSVGAQGTFGTTYLIQAGSARTSSYGLRVVNSSGNGGVPLGNLGAASCVFAFNVRVVSATGTVIVAKYSNANANLFLMYDASASKFGVKWLGGTTSWQTGTTATNTWTSVQVRAKINTATYHCDWWIENDGYQTSPADASTAGASTFDYLLLGSTAAVDSAQTVTMDFDDVTTSRYYAVWPLGIHNVKLIVPSGTGATVSGTSSNFQRFTSNGTLANVDGTEGALLDEVPPTVSASSDGVVQVTTAASDYLNLPMGTYTCAYDEVIAAVRVLFSEWGGTGSGTGTIGYRGWDGTTETTFQAASASYDADSLTAVSGTYPRWCAAMWPSTNGWTQAELDAAALRMGFSTDATPDMGISAAYLEVAIKTVDAARQVTLEDPISATVDLYVNPDTSATVSYVITNHDPARSVNFNYSISGTPQTPVTVTAGSSSTLQLNADAFGDISDVGLEPV